MKISEFKKLIKEEIQNALFEEMTHTPGVILKPAIFNSRPTLLLTMDSDAYKKVADQFDSAGRPIGTKVKNINFNNTSWSLYSQKIPSSDKSKNSYRIYGVAGDYTFGGAPTYYQSKYSGNKQAALYVFSKFIKDFNL